MYYYVYEAGGCPSLGVASGLYRWYQGSPRFRARLPRRWRVAQGGRFAGPVTSALFRAALVAGKRARSETGISRNAASISHVAVQLARQLLSPN